MQSTIRKSAMRNGLIIGLLVSLEFIFSVLNISILAFISIMISISIIALLYVLSIKFRDEELGGIISFGHAFSYILQVYLFGAIILSLIVLIYTTYINPSYLDVLKEFSIKTYRDLHFNFNDSDYKALDVFFKPSIFAIVNLFTSLVKGAFWALILAAFVKKEESIF